jgi:hypothetical protein
MSALLDQLEPLTPAQLRERERLRAQKERSDAFLTRLLGDRDAAKRFGPVTRPVRTEAMEFDFVI